MTLSLRISNKDINAYWGWFLAWGILLLVLGIAAISAATLTTLISVLFLGFVITIGGVVIMIDTFTFWWRRWQGFILHLLIALLYLVVGVMLINNPVAAAASLTLFLGILYIFAGIFRVIYSLTVKLNRWGLSFFSGLVSLLLGILIVSSWPSSSLFIIGLFVGIDLVIAGWVYIMGALTAKNLGNA